MNDERTISRTSASPEDAESRDVRVVVAGGDGGLRVRVTAGEHVLVADEPVAVGGRDTGPDPYDLLLASLGACKAMTVRLYADRKGWSLTGTRIELSHRRIYAEDCADCESGDGKVDEIQVALEFAGSLDTAQRKRLAEIAEMCPVHRTLSGEIKIRSRVSES